MTKWGGVVAELFDKLLEMYSIQPCLIKFVSDLGQIYGFRGLLWILRFPLSIKLTIAITEILMKVGLNRHNPVEIEGVIMFQSSQLGWFS